MKANDVISKIQVSGQLKEMLGQAPEIVVPTSRDHLIELALGGTENSLFEVAYDIPGVGKVVEAAVARCKNGVVINYTETHIRRRDPDCMVIGDDKPSDKERYRSRFQQDFMPMRELTMEWLSKQELIVMPFKTGGGALGFPMLLVAPKNAGFFAAGLADLQCFIPFDEIPDPFVPKAVIFLAPPFRHTHFNGKQVVVHHRLDDVYELFSYNLYPGPSAKKGVYGILLSIGEEEGWTTLHGSTVKVITPYDNEMTMMHEGASGGGKSEMLGQLHRELDGRILLGRNTVSGESLYLDMKETCELRPVTDDMALCHPSLQNAGKKLTITDAENGWFIRTDHITKYGTDPYLESMCIVPPAPLIFLNYDSVPNSTCLIWEPTMDAPGKPCPNPRVIVPRNYTNQIISEPVEVDIRSFGVRTPLCSRQEPTYGILGLFHILPPSLAWLWRLVSPRGHANPSVMDTEGMSSEGVGSYWPFSSGKKVRHANILLDQMTTALNTGYILVPNQHIGVYKVGFMPQWIAREYFARKGSVKFNENQVVEARSPLLGYALSRIKIDGTYVPQELLEVNLQPEVGKRAYDSGAAILKDFFKAELRQFMNDDLSALGKQIIDCCMSDGKLQDYLQFIPDRSVRKR